MTDAQVLWLFALLVGLLIVTLKSASDLSKRVSRLERQNDKQLDMLIALLNRNGIDPVTLD